MRRRLVSSDASPTPSGATICGDNGTTRSPRLRTRGGPQRPEGAGDALFSRTTRPSPRPPWFRLAPADGDESPAAGGRVGDIGPAAITASNRHRSRATWSDSIPRPRPRRRGRWQVTKVCGPEGAGLAAAAGVERRVTRRWGATPLIGQSRGCGGDGGSPSATRPRSPGAPRPALQPGRPWPRTAPDVGRAKSPRWRSVSPPPSMTARGVSLATGLAARGPNLRAPSHALPRQRKAATGGRARRFGGGATAPLSPAGPCGRGC